MKAFKQWAILCIGPAIVFAVFIALTMIVPAYAESTMQRDAPTTRFYTPDGKSAGTAWAGEMPSFPKEWQGEWCFSHTDTIKRHVPARAGTEPFDATVARSFYKRGRCKEDQKITIERDRYSSAATTCRLRTAHIAYVSVLELGGKVMCDFADFGNGIDEHIRVSRRSDSLSVEFDGEITPYEGD